MRMKVTTLVLFGALAVLVGCQSAQEKQKAEQREYLQKLLLFQRADVSRNRVVSLPEFKRMFASSDQKSVEELFARWDLNGNGVISQKEWMAIQ